MSSPHYLSTVKRLKFTRAWGGRLQIDLGLWAILYISTMAVHKKKNVATKRRILTKREKVQKRVTRVHKAIERKRHERQKKKKNASSIRRRLAEVQENQVVAMAEPQQQEDHPIDAEMNLLNLLGLNHNDANSDWEDLLEKKLKEVDQKSLDNPEVKRVYGQIGKIFTRYRSGKVPKAFKIIPNLEHWREVVAMTKPELWTSQAMVQAVNIFASNFDPLRAQEFYKMWLVPAVKRDLASSKKLNVHLYESLKKAMYKTNAWFKGIMFEFCAENTLLRQTKVIESLLSKMSIPVISASVAMLKLMELPPTSPVIHYLSALLNKHYTLPKRVLSTLTTFLLSFANFQGDLTVVWQTLLLTLAKQYGQSLDEMQKSSLKDLAKNKMHKLITPEIIKHLQ